MKRQNINNKNYEFYYFYNVFRNAKSIQIQPIIANLLNIRQIAKQIRIGLN